MFTKKNKIKIGEYMRRERLWDSMNREPKIVTTKNDFIWNDFSRANKKRPHKTNGARQKAVNSAKAARM
jgi:hypothetical protein